MKKLFITAFTAISLSACVDTQYINQIDLQNTDFSTLAYKKQGRACTGGFLFFIPAETERSIAKAALSAGISKVSYVETESFNAWPLVWNNCILVYGE